ncbi:hypothetical protein BD289DRAFT_437143 [Coniella lustricola]|uniref:Uncharacterized protein n=1 Tax=Coniella lustricola TaxID=2025994 RepID=A0A2T3A496_9PEZI|nr:hypothetical protein BD289DRAFT_437143 [Coniella lustricola]
MDLEAAKEDQRRQQEYQQRLAEEALQKRAAPVRTAWKDLPDAAWGPVDDVPVWTPSDTNEDENSETNVAADYSFWGSANVQEQQDDVNEPIAICPEDNAMAHSLDGELSTSNYYWEKLFVPETETTSSSDDVQQEWDDWSNCSAWDTSPHVNSVAQDTPATSRCHSASDSHNDHQTADDSDDDDFLLCTGLFSDMKIKNQEPVLPGELPYSVTSVASTPSRSDVLIANAQPSDKDRDRVALLLLDTQWNELTDKLITNEDKAYTR